AQCRPRSLGRSLLDRASRICSPLSHGAIIHAGILVAENFAKREPGQRCPMAGVAEGDVLIIQVEAGLANESRDLLAAGEAGALRIVELAMLNVHSTRDRACNANDRALALAEILVGRAAIDELDAVLQALLHLSCGGEIVLVDLNCELGWLWLHRIGADFAIGGLPTAPSTIEDGDSVVAKGLERPVNAGRAAKFAGVDASRHDDDVIVIVDAKAADQSLDLFERRQLAWDTLYFH